MSLRRALLSTCPPASPTPARTVSTRLRTVLLLLVGALALAVISIPRTAAAQTWSHARTSYERQLAVAVQNRLNGERRAHHLAPLTTRTRLMSSARAHDVTMARFNLMSHQLPGEQFFATRILATGYHYRWAGENIAWNSQISTAGVLQLEDMMYNERPPFDGHRLNILNPHFRNVGVDVFVDQVHHKVWLTTDFGAH